jgi:hypothetical protein
MAIEPGQAAPNVTLKTDDGRRHQGRRHGGALGAYTPMRSTKNLSNGPSRLLAPEPVI